MPVILSETKWSEEPSPALRDELTDFVSLSRLCRSKAEGNLKLISHFIRLVLIVLYDYQESKKKLEIFSKCMNETPRVIAVNLNDKMN